jgi:hypothetical protein
MCNPIQLVVWLPGSDGGQVVEGLEVAAVPDVGPQPGQQAAALGQAIKHLHLSGSPLGKCVAGLQQVLIHLREGPQVITVEKNPWRSWREGQQVIPVEKKSLKVPYRIGSGAGLDPDSNESVNPDPVLRRKNEGNSCMKFTEGLEAFLGAWMSFVGV